VQPHASSATTATPQLPQLFQILDTQDQLALIKRLYKAHSIDDERFPPRQLQYFIANAKDEGLRPNEIEAGDDLARRQVEHYALYEAMCQREGVVDFAELLLRSYELLARHDGLREHYRVVFRICSSMSFRIRTCCNING